MICVQSYCVNELAGYINWLYFFHAWHFPSHYGRIVLNMGPNTDSSKWLLQFPAHEQQKAKEAFDLWKDALVMLKEWDEASLHTHFKVGLFAACSMDDNVWLPEEQVMIPFLRQQHNEDGKPCYCWADFVRPQTTTGENDTIGVFAATVDKEMEEWGEGDEYKHLLAQTLADRLAEATAELGHLNVRRRIWGYAPHEEFTAPQLFASQYQGCRPAVGYPSLPDQSLIFLLASLIDYNSMGISLTENGAMIPHASTTGLMFAHPAAHYFDVGTIGEDQLQDYAMRRGMPADELRRFLSSSLRATDSYLNNDK